MSKLKRKHYDKLLEPMQEELAAMSAIRNYLPKMLWMISFLHFY